MSIAIDIGTRYLHLVQGNVRKKRVIIKQAYLDSLPSGVVQDGIIREFGGMEMALRNMLSKYNIKDKDCILTINGNHIYTKEMVVPRSKRNVLQDVVAFEMESSMNSTKPMAVEFVASKKPVPDQPNMVQVKSSAILLDYVNDYQKLLRKCKLKPAVLDIHPNATAKVLADRAINDLPIRDSGNSVLFLDIGAVTCSAYIYSKGEIIYSRIIPIGGLDVERYIMLQNEKSPVEQKKMLSEVDVSLEILQKDAGLADAIRPMIMTINDGVQRILQYLANRLQNNRVNRIYLFGQTAVYEGLDRTMAESFGIQTEVIRSIEQVTMPPNVPVAPFVNAIGALVRQD